MEVKMIEKSLVDGYSKCSPFLKNVVGRKLLAKAVYSMTQQYEQKRPLSLEPDKLSDDANSGRDQLRHFA